MRTVFDIIMVALLLVTVAVCRVYGQSKADYAACHADAVRYCSDKFGVGDMAVAGCLVAHKEQLKPACRAALASHGL